MFNCSLLSKEFANTLARTLVTKYESLGQTGKAHCSRVVGVFFFAHYISNVHFENRGKIFLIPGRWLSETERLLIVYRVVFVEVGQPDDEAWLFASWVLGLVFITSLGSISDSVSSINSSFQSCDLTEQFTFILQVV